MEDKTIFLEVFGETPVLKVLDFMCVNEDFDQSMTDIAQYAGVGYATLKLLWPQLEKYGIVKLTRKVGRAKMYKLNQNNPIVKKFRALYWETARTVIHTDLKKIKVTT